MHGKLEQLKSIIRALAKEAFFSTIKIGMGHTAIFTRLGAQGSGRRERIAVKKIGFIDHYLHEWHADNYPKWIREASGGAYEVAYCWGDIDCPLPGGKTNAQWAAEQGIALCGSIEEVIEKSDVLCVLAPDSPETHERLTRLPLMSGKRTYVDKTFAPDAASAGRMIELALQHSTPMITSSALRFAEEYAGLPREGIRSVMTMGSGLVDRYIIHQIEPLVMLTGGKARRVINVGRPEQPWFVFDYPSGMRAQTAFFSSTCNFRAMVDYEGDVCRILNIESDFFQVFIRELIRFYDTGEILVPYEQTMAVASMREACIKAWSQPDTWIAIA